MSRMKALVAYMSSTGNTKKIAEAIYGELSCEKELKSVKEISGIEGYDVAFLGFPVHGYGPDKKTVEILQRDCRKGRKVALFITHAAEENEARLPQWLDKFKSAASEAEIVGFFNCQGQLSGGTKFIMRFMSKELRQDAKKDNSHGQPDASRVEKAKAFARETMSRLG